MRKQLLIALTKSTRFTKDLIESGRRVAFLMFLLFFTSILSAQSRVDSLLGKLDPQRFANAVSEQANILEKKLIAKGEKVLKKMQQSEEKLYKKMLKGKDSLLAKTKLEEIKANYQAIKNPPISGSQHYIPELDSLTTSLKFLKENGLSDKVKSALASSTALQSQFNYSERIKKFIKERKEQLKEILARTELVKQLMKINKAVYYYSAQIQEYKNILKNPKNIQKKVLHLLSRSKIFKDFMRKNSMLASLFRLPPDPDDLVLQVNLGGLQTRAQINSLIQQQISGGGPNAQTQLQQNIQSAQSQLSSLRNRIMGSGGSTIDGEMPDFKPNQQKTKSFLKRLEYSANVQMQKASNFFPTTGDIGLSMGYKISDNGIIGVGMSYKLGLGRGWNDINITNEGIGLRSYVDLKLKGSIWLSGGYEQNYKNHFKDIDQLRNRSAWQQSGLVGIMKQIPIKKKLLKNTSVKLLWDFLSYQQIPRTQPFIFRVGYSL